MTVTYLRVDPSQASVTTFDPGAGYPVIVATGTSVDIAQVTPIEILAAKAGVLLDQSDNPPDGYIPVNPATGGEGGGSTDLTPIYTQLAGKLSVSLNLSDLTSPANARTNLGLGDMALASQADFVSVDEVAAVQLIIPLLNPPTALDGNDGDYGDYVHDGQIDRYGPKVNGAWPNTPAVSFTSSSSAVGSAAGLAIVFGGI